MNDAYDCKHGNSCYTCHLCQQEEIDRLKGEAVQREARVMMYISQISNLERQLSRYKEEVERLNAHITQLDAIYENGINLARKRTTREILDYILGFMDKKEVK